MKIRYLYRTKTFILMFELCLCSSFAFTFNPLFALNPKTILPNDSLQVTNALFLASGISGYYVSEKAASPLIYSSFMVPFQFGFEHFSSTSIWNTSMKMTIGNAHASSFKSRDIPVYAFDEDGNLTSSVVNLGKMPSGYLTIQGEYLARTGYLLNGKLAWYNGLKIQEYLFQQSTITSFFMNQFTLNPKTTVLYLVNDVIMLSSSLSFTLIALNTRLNYSRDPYTPDEKYLSTLFAESGFNTLNKFQRVDFSLSIQTMLGKRWLAALSYQLYWFHQNNFQGIKLYEKRLQITLSRTFKNKKK
jgi:hypothetical protein